MSLQVSYGLSDDKASAMQSTSRSAVSTALFAIAIVMIDFFSMP